MVRSVLTELSSGNHSHTCGDIVEGNNVYILLALFLEMHQKWLFLIACVTLSVFAANFALADVTFIRGDANFDGKVDLSDSIFLNNYLFKGGSSPGCDDAADTNDDGKIDISDSIYLNNFLFLGTGSPPPAPYPDLGVDPTVDGIGCGPDGAGGACQSSYCDAGIRESAEGPGGNLCACNSNGDDGFEECYDYKTKSTAAIPQFNFDPPKSDTDSCVDSQTLREVAIDCEWLSQDILVYEDKNCNGLNVPGPWSNYYCENNEVKRRRALPDYDCGNGACYVGGGGFEEEVLSRLGSSDYCVVKKSKCGVGCSEGEYDCDSNSECSTGLVCLGPAGGAADGCCKDGQIWDTTNFECDDCVPGSGPCCRSDGKFKPDTVVCNNNLGVEYACRDGNCVEDGVFKRVKIEYCSGRSSTCNGGTAWATSVETFCDSTQFCSGSTTWGSTKPSCKNAQCTEGECCDNTCGVYAFKGNDWICDFKLDEGCPWGTDLGNDAGKRSGGIVCSGTTNTCGDGPLRWRDWLVKQDCSGTQYCDLSNGISSCRTIVCSQKSECGTDGWLDERFCMDNNVWDKWRIWTCNNAGTKSSSCSFSNPGKLRVDCQESCQDGSCVVTLCTDNDGDGYGTQISSQCPKPGIDCNDNNAKINLGAPEICGNSVDENCNGNGDDPCGANCSDNTKNQDETDINCGGTICGKCANSKSCKISNDCQSNYCNPITLKCENLSAGCTDNDKDGYGAAGSSGCSKTGADCNDNNAAINPGAVEVCDSVDNNCVNGADEGCPITTPKPDLTATSLVVQSPLTTPTAGQNITMAFTLKNIGTANATGVFWRLDTGSSDPDPVNTLGLRIDAGKSITVFTRIRYASAGSYTAKVIVDYQNTIVESNEGNNELTRGITVK